MYRAALVVSVSCMMANLAGAQSYMLRTYILAGGGSTSLQSSNYRCGLTTGQATASFAQPAGQYLATFGFWHQQQPDGGIAEDAGHAPSRLSFLLGQNMPNPFGARTAFRYSLPKESDVALRVYNSVGRVVTTLVQTKQSAGRYAVSWDVSGVPATRLPCGTYFCRLEAGEFAATRKMVKSE
jgi:hypothetical protein